MYSKNIEEEFGLSIKKVQDKYKKPFKYKHKEPFNIGLIVGSSGVGKTTLLKEYNKNFKSKTYNNDIIINNFHSYEEGKKRLLGVGLNSIPTWLLNINQLSNGEYYRALMALNLEDNAIFDEFTSVVDRPTAKSMALNVGKYIRKNNLKNIVIASPHRDIIEYLEPDWVYDLNEEKIILKDNLRRRENIKIKFKNCGKELWGIFSKHHYLDEILNKSSNVFLAFWGDVLVGFYAVLAFPSGTVKNAFRGHRLVVLPEFQGMGIGNAISNSIAQYYKDNGKVFYIRTIHPAIGEYMEKSTLWSPTARNKTAIDIKDKENIFKNSDFGIIRYSHKYIGDIKINYIESKYKLEDDEW